MDKNSCSLSDLVVSHCSSVYSSQIEALLSAKALAVIGCQWQGSQLFRDRWGGVCLQLQSAGTDYCCIRWLNSGAR